MIKVIIQTDERCLMYEIDVDERTDSYITIQNFYIEPFAGSSIKNPCGHDVIFKVKDARRVKVKEITPPDVEVITGGAQ